ncbi:ATP-binding protein [Planobispora longispora]|uniref:ATP-binding protein n=1 Tax=Planobispora longispora TaxID=28887 RepID=UPI00360CEFD4
MRARRAAFRDGGGRSGLRRPRRSRDAAGGPLMVAAGGPLVPTASGLRRTAGFAALFLVATFAGRMTVIEGSSLSLVWPSAGVAVLWFMAQRHERSQWLDAVAFSVITFAVNAMTGASSGLAICFVIANLVQVAVFLRLFKWLCPDLWEAESWGRFNRVQHVWRLLLVAGISTLCGTAVGPTAVWVFTDQWSWTSTAVWLIRNTVSVVLIGAVGLRLGRFFSSYGDVASALRASWGMLRGLAMWRALECAALVTASAAAYIVAFAINHGLPLAFPLLAVTVWAGLRFNTTFVVLHDLAVGTAGILFTLNGHGPFASIESAPARAMVAQVFVGLVTLVGLTLALSRDEREALLRQLTAAEESASAQAGLLTTIVDTMHDGLAVMDAGGRFLLRNPATHRLLGGMSSPTDRIAASEHYGLFHPDGRPLRDDEMPHLRALTGHVVSGVDVVVRNPGVPEGRTLNVTAIPMPSVEDEVIVVLHDVTAERRHRDELAAFAGVVAHDLRNPLTTIEGWVDILAETVEERPGEEGPGSTKDIIARIQRASVRMRNLIQDLLAYTTARDAAIKVDTVCLEDVVRDIVSARADLPAGREGTRTPLFHLGDLPEVRADPALLRQLMDNLISNAVKYTAPGSTPDIAITAAPASPGWIRVEVADRGIGIPPGQHGAIFENFHRAHVKQGYTGSGLGLAICKRIVERHGERSASRTIRAAGPASSSPSPRPADRPRAVAPGTGTGSDAEARAPLSRRWRTRSASG